MLTLEGKIRSLGRAFTSSSLFLFAKAGKNAEKKCRDPTWPINNGQVEGQVTK